MTGLAGIGDLVVTCASPLSRNHRVGAALARGEKLDDVVARLGMVAEGVLTTNAAVGLAHKHGVEMPITEQMHAILQNGKAPHEAMHELMTRPFTTEIKLY